MQIGAGYDSTFNGCKQNTICIISFCFFQPYFGQNPRSTETWNNTTVRAGVALKFGQGKTFKKLLISKQTNKFRFL
jgi:hypothetical protein